MPKEKISFGLDIGTATLKLVRLKFDRDLVQLSGFSLKPLSSDINGTIKNMAQELDAKKVNFSVSGSPTIIRYIDFPRMSDIELMQAMKFEAQKHIPYPLQDVNYDTYILKQGAQGNKILVLLAAVKKDFLESRIKVIEEAGLKPVMADIDSLALLNLFNFTYQDRQDIRNKTVALLNIGASDTNLNILEDALPYMSRDIHIAGNNISQKIAETLSLDLASAEKQKTLNPKENIEKINVATESVLANLAAEIRTSFDYYESQRASSVTRIFLSGGSAKVVGLKDILANLLGIEVEIWDPFAKIAISGNLDAQSIKASSTQLAVAMGLALRG